MKKSLTLGSTLEDLTLHSAYLDLTCEGRDITRVLKANPSLPGVILTRDGEFYGMVSRRRYFEFMSRPYSLDLFFERPLFKLYPFAKVEFLVINSQTAITKAVKLLFEESPDLLYEPIVVRAPFKVYQLLDVPELLRAQLDIHELTETVLNQSKLQLQEQTQQLEYTLSQLQQTQAQLIQTEKMSSLGQLVAGIAHEINNPASFIYGNLFHANRYIQDLLELVQLYQAHHPHPAQAVQDKMEEIDLDFLKEDLASVLNSMESGTERIRDLVLSLRNFGRLDETGIKRVEIHEGLESTLLVMNNRFNPHGDRSKKITVEKNYGDLPKIYCSPGQLNQVFMNILGNAVDALDQQASENLRSAPAHDKNQLPSPHITIGTDVDGDYIYVSIMDNGPGMTETVKEKLFDPFFTTKPVGSGTGLGLSISYEIIVNQHDGKIACISEPGQGAEFIIALPIQPASSSRASSAETSPE
ncbi:MAG: sensor histidine kinase [Microcoleaceae cyanobacterium]